MTVMYVTPTTPVTPVIQQQNITLCMSVTPAMPVVSDNCDASDASVSVTL
jgi:hypothetical protein